MQKYNKERETRSLYIHWPFCPYRCHFCPFVALAGHDQFMAQYHKALTQEIKDFFASYSTKPTIDTIFLGGGTLSTYPDDLLLDTFGILSDVAHIDPSAEVTIEVNPGTVRLEQFEIWKSCGINRMSAGVQSLNDGVLKDLNRHQKAVDVFALIQQAHKHLDNISVDLILGLPNVSDAEWQETIRYVASWPILHISIYFLTVHEQTQLYYRVAQKQIELPPDDRMIDLYHWTCEYLAEAGFDHYELSNFAREGKYSRHNTMYWERKPFKGFGLGAWSFDGRQRLQNEKNLMTYMEILTRGDDCTFFTEELTEEQIRLEKLMLGLRRSVGVSIHDVFYHTVPQKHDALQNEIHRLIDEKFLCESNQRLMLTAKGLVVENQIITRLMP